MGYKTQKSPAKFRLLSFNFAITYTQHTTQAEDGNPITNQSNLFLYPFMDSYRLHPRYGEPVIGYAISAPATSRYWFSCRGRGNFGLVRVAVSLQVG